MKKISLWSLLISAFSILLLSACGGGGGASQAPLPSDPTTAVLSLSTKVDGTIPSTTTINSYDVTITLPAYVTVTSTVSPPETDPGVVTIVGSPARAGSLVSTVFSAATTSTAGTIKVHIASASGFSAGIFCKVQCSITSGSGIKESDFAPPTLDDATGFDTATSSTVLGLEKELLIKATVKLQ
jgi:hypothetical protein